MLTLLNVTSTYMHLLIWERKSVNGHQSIDLPWVSSGGAATHLCKQLVLIFKNICYLYWEMIDSPPPRLYHEQKSNSNSNTGGSWGGGGTILTYLLQITLLNENFNSIHFIFSVPKTPKQYLHSL